MAAPWGAWWDCGKGLRLLKLQTRFEDYPLAPRSPQDVVFFDAFSPAAVPAQWGESLFSFLYELLPDGGVLATYSSSGVAKRALRAAGFVLKRLPGALGKHHMLVALRNPPATRP